jgi:outer membrane protein assembly factor BamB
MSPDDRHDFDRLDAAWRALERGASATAVAGVERETAELLHAIQVLYAPVDVPAPDWSPIPSAAAAERTGAAFAPPSIEPVDLSARRTPRPWLAWLSAAALLLLTMAAIAYFAVQSADDQTADPGTAVPTTVPVPRSGDWRNPRGGPDRTGFTPDSGPSGPPAIAWTAESRASLAPIASGGLLITITGEGNVVALRATDGELAWVADLPVKLCAGDLWGPWCNGVSADDARVVYASAIGVVGALDARTGALLWQQEAPGVLGTGGPLLTNDRVFVLTTDGGIRSFDLATGEPGWSRPGSATAVPEAHGALAYVDGVIYSADSNGTVVAARADTGEIVWSSTVDLGGTKTPYGFVMPSTPVAAEGRLLVSVSDPNRPGHGELLAIDTATGQVAWRFAGLPPFTAVSPPAVAFGLVYTVEDDGTLVALDLATGTEQWRSALPDKVSEPATIGGETIYLTLRNRELVAVDARSGTLLWTVKGIGQLLGGPVVIGDSIYGAADNGPVIALRASAATQFT